MILTTTEQVPGRRTVEVLGIVRGSAVRGRFFLRDVAAWFRLLVGGEIPEYTKLMAEVREQALDRMRDRAAAMGADAVVQIRFATSEILAGAAEFTAYGTAVRLAPPD